MIPNYNKVHLKFKLNKIHYSYDDLMEVAYSFVKEGLPYEKTIGDFLLDWLDEKEYIDVNTSGSTGKPKRIKVTKQAMVNSAIATGDFFNLKPGDSALHCLPTSFIAGKMMLVRAIILGLELDVIEPTSKLKFDTKKHYTFCAMVPLQLQNALEKCNNVKTIIVGGASVSNTLKKAVLNIDSSVYETYGMTETVTHIAVKKLNNYLSLRGETTSQFVKSTFKILPNVLISQDKRNCLVINASKLSEDKIVTNDIVKLHSLTSFEWLGRYDNVINSGGVKLCPEQIETKLQNKIEQRFFIASEKEEVLGEQLILVVEGNTNKIDDNIFSDLEKFEKPKIIYSINQFIETTSGKIQRKETLKQLKF